MLKNIFLNQRWFSQGEPELGLGVVSDIQDKMLTLDFPSSGEVRTYGMNTAPIKRVKFESGDSIHIEGVGELEVIEVLEEDNLCSYKTANGVFSETQLDSQMDFTSAADKLLALSFDSDRLFKSRYESYIAKRNYQLFSHKGLLGSRVRLIDHQAYITDVISNRLNPRVLLSDEVGLGKTIESALILNSLILKNKSQNALIVVPDSLVYQWYFELKFKFNLEFKPMSINDELEIEVKNLEEGQNFIISSKKLKEDKDLLKEVIEMDWDALIVDEVHQYTSELDIAILDEISSISKSVFFLSATPKINGNQNHFKKLEILEPNKFSDFDTFHENESHYSELIPVIKKIIEDDYSEKDLLHLFSKEDIALYNTKEKIISALIDRHGTGRLIFRNTRDHLEKFDLFFPKRVLHEKKLKNTGALSDKIVFSLKLMHLKEILTQYPDEKVLLLVHSKEIAKKIHSSLSLQINAKMALFYSEQSLMERDRQAAFFSEKDGARLLICTEIGSEGRNFEFASHIFLFDLPKVPEQLEQRIGRLDRVGQKKDINIHVPFIEKSFEEVLFTWYKDVLASFSKAPKAASEFYVEKKSLLLELISNPFDEKKLARFIEKSKEEYTLLLDEVSKGHDALLDLNSFNAPRAKEIIQDVQDFNAKNNLIGYLEKIFDSVGVDFDSLNEKTYYIKPTDNMLIPSYPGLDSDGVSVTDSREFALYRDDINFLSWEHPLVLNTIELFTNSQIGNTSLVAHEGELPGPVLFEFIFKLEAISKLGEIATDYLPVTPIRVLLSATMEDITKKFPKKIIDQVCREHKSTSSLEGVPKESLKQIISKASSLATQRAKKYIDKALSEVKEDAAIELNKLEDLHKINPLVDEVEIMKLKALYKSAGQVIQESKAQLDAVRIVLQV